MQKKATLLTLIIELGKLLLSIGLLVSTVVGLYLMFFKF